MGGTIPLFFVGASTAITLLARHSGGANNLRAFLLKVSFLRTYSMVRLLRIGEHPDRMRLYIPIAKAGRPLNLMHTPT